MPDAARTTAPRTGHRTGRHALRRRPSAVRSRVLRGVDVAARVGGVVSLAALLVLGVAVAGAVGGTLDGPADGVGAARPGVPTVTVTIAGR